MSAAPSSSFSSSSSSSIAEDKELNNQIDEVGNLEHTLPQSDQAQNTRNLSEYEELNSGQKVKLKDKDDAKSNDSSKTCNRLPNNGPISKLCESTDQNKQNASNTCSNTNLANENTLELPRILSIEMPTFERSFRNTVLIPLTSPSSSQKVGSDSIDSSNDSMQEAAKILRCLMRCVYSMALDLTFSSSLNMIHNGNTQTSINKSRDTVTPLNEFGRFSDKSAEQTFRQNLLPYTIRSLLMIRGDEASIRASSNYISSNDSSFSSSSSQTNKSLLLSSREENIYLTLLLDFVELSSNMLKLNGSNDVHLQDYLGREWLISLCKIFGDLHYWEYTEDDWRGLGVTMDGSSRNGCALQRFYHHYGHNRVDCCAQKYDVHEVSTMISSFSEDEMIFTRFPLLASSTTINNREFSNASEQNEPEKDTIIVSLMHDEFTMSVSFYLLAMSQYFIQQNGLCMLGTMIFDDEIASNNIEKSLDDKSITQSTNDEKRVSLAPFCSIINIVRAIVSVSWINTCSSMDSRTLTQIIRFRDIIYRYISMLRVGYDIVSGTDRQILFSLLDSFCNTANLIPQNNILGGLLLDSNISMQLRLDAIWKMLCGENTTLQSRIFGLNELRNRITDAVQDLDSAKSKAEEFFLYEQEKMSLSEKKKQNSPTCIINDDQLKSKSFPCLDITETSPNNSVSDNVSTTVYAHSSCGNDGESSHDDDQHRIDFEENEEWTKRRIDLGPSSTACDNVDESTYVKSTNDNMNDSNSPTTFTCKDKHNNYDPTKDSKSIPSLLFNYKILDPAKQEIDRLISFLIEDHSFLDTLLSPSYLHPELLKRFIIIPSFLAEQNALTSDDIETIWNAAKTSSHESIQYAVYELVIGLLDKLERTELITLGELLSSVPYELVTDKYLLLVHNFAMASLGVLKNIDDKEIPLGVDLLWDLVQETVPLRKGLHQTVISYILNIGNKISTMCNDLDGHQTSYGSNKFMQQNFCSAINTTKMWLLENAVDGIKHGKSSIPCQLIINNMLRLWSGQEEINLDRNRKPVDCECNSMNQKTMISSTSLASRFATIKKYDLVSLVINDLCRYMNHFRDFVHSRPNLSSEEIDGFIPSGGCYSHAISLSSRLEFLKFILGISFNAFVENPFADCSCDGNNVVMKSKIEDENNLKSRRKINIEDVDEKDPILKLPNSCKGVVEHIDLSLDNSQHGDNNLEILSLKDRVGNHDLERSRKPMPMNPIVIEDDDDYYLDESCSKNEKDDTNMVSMDVSPKGNQKSIEINQEKRNLDVYKFEGTKEKKRSTATEYVDEQSLLTSTHIELLWSNIVENNHTPQESDLCLSALHSILATSLYYLSIKTYLAPILFDYCLSRLPVKPMTGPAFDLLALSMTCCNLIHGRYELFSLDTSKNQKSESIASEIVLGHLVLNSPLLAAEGNIQVRIVSFDILGTEKLWEIALTAKDEDVAKKAMVLQSTLYTFESITDELKQDVATQQRRFVQSCMSALNGGNDYNESDTSSKTYMSHDAANNKRKGEYIIRCLRLISTYADAIMKHALNAGVIPGASHDKTTCVTLPSLSHGYSTSEHIQKFTSGVLNYFNVRVQPSNGLPLFAVKCPIGATVSYLRKVVLDNVLDLENTVASTDSVDFNVAQKNSNSTKDSSAPLFTKSPIKDSTDYRLIYGGKELTKENMPITSYGISDGDVIYCWPRLSTKGIFLSHKRNANSHQTTVIDVEESTQFVEKRKRSRRNDSAVHFGRDEQQHVENLSDMTNIWKHPILAAITELVKSHHISVFFHLLSQNFSLSDKQIREIVWQLLQLLPTDPELKMELVSLVPMSFDGGGKKKNCNKSFTQIFANHNTQHCNWEKLLPPLIDPGKSFNLLYALQVVQSLTVEGADLKAASSKKAKLSEIDVNNKTKTLLHVDDRNISWKKLFFCRGGVAHLLNILLNIDTSTKGPFHFEGRLKGDNHDENYEEYLVSTNLLFLLRCIHHIQQLLIFFLKELKSTESDFMNDVTESSSFGLLISHILQTLHFSVSIQNQEWIDKQNSAMSTLNLNDELSNTKFPHYNTTHSSFGNDSRLSMYNDDASFDSSALNNQALASKEPIPHTKSEICTEAICISQHSLSLLEIIVLNAPSASFLNKLFNNSNGIDSNNLLSNAIASTLVSCPSTKVRKFGLNTFRYIFDTISNNSKSGKGQNNRLTSKILSIIVPLLSMGQKIDLIERFSDVFLLIRDLLNNIWKNTSDIDKENIIVIVEDEVSEIGTKISLLNLTGNTEIYFTDIGCIGKLLNWVCVAIVTTPIREQRRKSYPIDTFLVGLLKLADQIIQMSGNKVKENFAKYASSFMRHIFYNCLFSLPCANDNGPLSAPKCKTTESRDAALNLLKTLCKGSPDNLIAIHQQLLALHHTSLPRQNLAYEWHFDPISRDKGSTGHVGLRNLGATCYLNSLLQQFFFIKPFRYGVLSCKTNKENDSNSKGYDLLHELQLLFANLLLSERKDYDTSELCLSINDYDGNPIRPGEQQDVVEFFNLFGDRLENVLKSFDQRFLLQDVFGGELCHIITCQECKHRSQRSEDCLSLSLDVKGKSNIYESLKLYIQGEVLDGDNKYYCEKCQAKRNSLKMCCVSRLPNHLILHLKRFEFDLELMRKIKVNDRFEYPLEIDMYPYTKEGQSSTERGTNPMSVNDHEPNSDGFGFCKARPNGYYQYFLRGVLVHSGTADSGHYYSIARDSSYGLDESSGEVLANGMRGFDNQQWFCFNDSCVTPFDLSSLPSATFGGTKLGSKYDQTTHKMVQTESSKPYSAYLLIYERNHIEFKPRDANDVCTKNPVRGIDQNHVSPTNTALRWLPQFNKPDTDRLNTLQMEIFKELWDSNDCFLRDQVMFSPEYCKWLIEIAKSIYEQGTFKHEPLLTLEMTKVLTHFLLETLIHGKDTRNYSDQVTSILFSSYAESEETCRWILHEMSNKYKYWAEKILLHCPIVEVRANFVTLLSVVFRKMIDYERTLYCVENNDEVKPVNRMEQEIDDNSCDTDEEQHFDTDDDLVEVPIETNGKAFKSNNLIRLGRIRWWRSKSILAQFVGSAILEILPNCEQHWRRFDQLFEAILSFASLGQEESIYLIRCGLILRLLDIYLGDSGGVPQKSLVVKQSLQSQQTNTCRTRMGDKYTKPNMFPLLQTLDILIRSAVAIPDDDDDEDEDEDAEFDDDSDNDSVESELRATKAFSKLETKSKVSLIDLPQTLTPFALASMKSSSNRLELPRRDLALILTKKFFQTLFEESSLNIKEIEQSVPYSYLSMNLEINCVQRLSIPKISILKNIVCHLAFNNIDCTRLICEISGHMFEDRKADEFLLALEALLSVIQINDAYVENRIETVMNALITGINCNLKYEKESITIINGITSVLKNRTKGVSGTMAEASLHKWIMECIESEPLDWFRRQNTTGEVRHCIIGLLQSLLPVDQETITVSDEYKKKIIESSNFHKHDVNMTNENYESKSTSYASKTKVDHDVIVIGVVNNNDSKKGNEAESIITKWNQATNQSFNPKYSDSNKTPHYSSSVPYLSGKVVKKRLFFSLINIFDIVSKAIRTQASRSSAKFENRNAQPNSSMHNSVNHNAAEKFIDSSILATYFETLGSCLTGDDYEKGLLLQRHGGINERLASLLWEIDEEGRAEQRPSADIVKGEIIKLYEKMIKLHSSVGEEIALNFSLPMELPIDVDSVEKCDIDKSDKKESPGFSHDKILKKKKSGKRLIGATNESNSNDNDRKSKEARIEEIEDYRENKVDSVSKLLEIYVTSLRENMSYNVKYMSHYYSLLLLIAEEHDSFRRRILSHNNWRWALKAFVIAKNEQDYNALTRIIFEGTMKFIRDKEFRTLLVAELSAETYENGKKSLLTQQVSFETFCLLILRAIIECGDWNRGDEKIISLFVDDHDGIRQLSTSIHKFHKELENKDKSNPNLHTLLEGLSLSLECMFSILDTIGLNRIRALLSKWEEADDINFLCCQLVTRSTKDWENFLYQNDQETCRSETLRIIEFASGILTVLASVETTVVAE